MEVYVSSVANPDTFFVQILTSMSLQLDEVVKEMSQYYSKEREVRDQLSQVIYIATLLIIYKHFLTIAFALTLTKVIQHYILFFLAQCLFALLNLQTICPDTVFCVQKKKVS